MNEYQYTNIRAYLEGIASKQAELLTEQRRTNDLLATIAEQTKSVPLEPVQYKWETKDIADAMHEELREVLSASTDATGTADLEIVARGDDGISVAGISNAPKPAPKRSTKKAATNG